MSPQIIAAIILVAVFVLGTVRSVNIGALALMASLVVGPALLGVKVSGVLGGFPADLLVLVLGVTYLFSIAIVNGTIGWLVDRCARLVGGRRALLPVVLFVVSAVPTSLGALGPAAVAMLAPIALRLAGRYDVNVRLAGLMVLHGSTAGSFSPLNPLGAIVNGTVTRAGLASEPIFLFLVSFAYNVLLGVVVYLVMGGLPLLRHALGGTPASTAVPAGVGAGSAPPASSALPAGEPSAGGDGADPEPAPQTGVIQIVTLLCLLGVAVLSLGLRLDVGICALVAAVALNVVMPRSSAGAIQLISWNIILLICGIVTYVQLLQQTRTLDMLGKALTGMGSPLLAVLILCAVGALTSAFASSAGLLGAMIPLVVPVVIASGAQPVVIVTALGICITVVDASPFSSIGALVLSNTPARERDWMQAGLLRWCGAMVVTAPIVTGLILVLPAF